MTRLALVRKKITLRRWPCPVTHRVIGQHKPSSVLNLDQSRPTAGVWRIIITAIGEKANFKKN
jgi:hypothetical protein